MKPSLMGIGKKERSLLAALTKASSPAITPASASRILKIPQNKVAQLLALWTKKGWLSRVKRGVYIIVPLQSAHAEVMAEEPWVLGKFLFDPCYIGGWSAAHHWEFTEQIFNSVLIVTSKKIAKRNLDLHGNRFKLKTTKPNRMFGTKTIWLSNKKVEVSDPTKTIADAFNDPGVVGGIRMAIDILSAYMKSEHKNILLLLDYAQKIGNSAIFKRLGYVFQNEFPKEEYFIERCKELMGKGLSQLDPSAPGKTLVTYWGLWVPTSWKKKGIPHDPVG